MFPSITLPPAVPCPSLLAVTAAPAHQRRILHVDHYNVVGPAVYDRMEALVAAFAAATGREHTRANNLIRDGDEAALQALLARYAAADVIVSSRLHGCILGLASGCRVIAVSGDRKVDDFMVAAGLDEWVCDAQDVERLPEFLARVEQQPSPAGFLGRARNANRAIAESVRGLISRCA